MLAAFVAVLVAYLSCPPPTTNKEARVWKVVTSMSDSGELLVPRIDGEPHLTKPPLYYWLAVFSGKVAGATTLGTSRFPSVAAALALVLLAFYCGSRSAGVLGSLVCAAMLLSMARLPVWGRTATFEMVLALLCGIALVSFYLAVSGGRYGFFPVFCVAAGLAFLTKGTPVLIIVVAPCMLWVFLDHRLGLFARPSAYLWAVVGLAVALSWYVALLVAVPESRDIFISQILLPLGEETEHATATHYAPFYYYLIQIWAVSFPACLFIPLAVIRAFRTHLWRANQFCRFNALAFCTILALFSLVPGKQPHYILPALLPLAVVIAESIASDVESGKVFTTGAVRAFFIFIAGLLVAVIPAFVFFEWILVGRTGILVAAASVSASVLALALIIAATRRKWAGAVLLFALSMCAIQGFVVGEFLVWQSQFRASTVASRADYDAGRWQDNFSRFPLVAKVFREDPQHTFKSDPSNR